MRLRRRSGGKRRAVIIGTRGYPSYYGGFETLIRRLAPALVDEGWDLTVYGRPGATHPDTADPRVKTTTTIGLERQSLSTLTFGFTATLHAIASRAEVALVMNVANGYCLPLLRLFKIRVVVNVDGIEWEREKWGRAAKLAFRVGARFTAWFADELIFDAEAIGDYWYRNYGRTGTFIPYGGDPHYPTLDSPRFEPGTYALVVARFVPENTIDEFLAAIDLLPVQTPVVVVGSSGYGGPYDDTMRRLDTERTNVTWLGHIRDDRLLFSLWENCGAYFHGHSVGGTNPALVQAMACGAPIIARDTVYNREVLGSHGRFVQPTARAIANSLVDLLSDSAEQIRLSDRARERAAARYTWSSVCKSYHEAMLAASTDVELRADIAQKNARR